MASKAISGVGVELHRWDATSAMWKVISEVTSIKGPGMKRGTIEVTSLDSKNGYKEIIAGMREAGSISMGMNFVRGNYDQMKEDFESDELQNYEIIFPDTQKTSFEFTGLVTELPLSITAKDAISMDVTIEISGEVVVNDGENSSAPA